jgi:hypothetical protein
VSLGHVHTGYKLWNDSFVVVATERQHLKNKTVASLVCSLDTDLVPGQTEVTRMNGLTFHNTIPCMIMDVVEVGAILVL